MIDRMCATLSFGCCERSAVKKVNDVETVCRLSQQHGATGVCRPSGPWTHLQHRAAAFFDLENLRSAGFRFSELEKLLLSVARVSVLQVSNEFLF